MYLLPNYNWSFSDVTSAQFWIFCFYLRNAFNIIVPFIIWTYNLQNFYSFKGSDLRRIQRIKIIKRFLHYSLDFRYKTTRYVLFQVSINFLIVSISISPDWVYWQWLTYWSWNLKFVVYNYANFRLFPIFRLVLKKKKKTFNVINGSLDWNTPFTIQKT